MGGLSIPGFGEAFVNSYNSTSKIVEDKRRGDLLANADVRAEAAEGRLKTKFTQEQEEYAEEKARAKKMYDLTTQYIDQAVQGARGTPGAGPPPPPTVPTAQQEPGPVPPPLSPEPSAPVGQALSGPQTAAPVPPAGAPRVAALTAPEGVVGGGPAPPPAQSAPAPLIQPPQKSVVDHIKDGYALNRQLMPEMFMLLRKTHPAEASKMIQQLASSGVQEHMAKSAALATMAATNPDHPAIPGLVKEMDPTYVDGSWRVDKTDQQGRRYASYDRQMPDGSTKTVPVNEAQIKVMLAEQLSPLEILNFGQREQAVALKAKEVQSEITSREAATQLGIDRLKEVKREFDVQGVDRASDRAYKGAMAGAAVEQKKASIEDRTARRKADDQRRSLDLMLKLNGVTADTIAKDSKEQGGTGTLEAKIGEAIGAVDGMIEDNGLEVNPMNISKLNSTWNGIVNGTIGVQRDKNGQWITDSGNVDKPLRLRFVPPSVREAWDKRQAQAAAAAAKANPVPATAPGAGRQTYGLTQ